MWAPFFLTCIFTLFPSLTLSVSYSSAHRNDLENVLPFLLMSLAYVACSPHPLTAKMLIRIGASARLLHTIVYAVLPLPQPTRAICFFITFGIVCFEAIYVIICSIKYI